MRHNSIWLNIQWMPFKAYIHMTQESTEYRVDSWNVIYLISKGEIGNGYTLYILRGTWKWAPFWTVNKKFLRFVSWHILLGGWLSKSWVLFVCLVAFEILRSFDKIKLTPIKKWQVQKLFCRLDSSTVKPLSPLIKGGNETERLKNCLLKSFFIWLS